MPRKPLGIQARFERSYIPEPNSGCYLFTGCLNRAGYGWMSRSRAEGPVRAHRVSYELYVGPIPEGMVVCHRCDQPSCVNPDHLFLGSLKDNAVDMARKFRGRRSARGLPYGVRPRNGRFMATVRSRSGTKSFGTYDTQEEAHAAAIAGKRLLLGMEKAA